MKAGAKYERFVFEKLKRLFAEGVVKLNDKIPGSESGIERETEALAELNRDKELTLDLSLLPVRSSGEGIAMPLAQYILQRVRDPATHATEGVGVDLSDPALELKIAGDWVPCSQLAAILHCQRVKYLKYLTPAEYSQLRDHVRGTTLPLHCKLDGISLRLDNTFIELSEENIPVFPGLWLEVEESSVIPERAS